jgi:hypothetical protein
MNTAMQIGRRAEPLSAELIAEFLTHLGLPAKPEVTPRSLTRIYEQWCAFVPYDNYLIRKAIIEHPHEEIVGIPSALLLRNVITDGHASQCTETADAFYCLLTALGFDVELSLAYFGPRKLPPLLANHISVIVRFGADRLVVDTVMLVGRPIPLRDHEAFYPPLHYRISRMATGNWRIDTTSPVKGTPLNCVLIASPVDRAVCHEVYRNIQGSEFRAINNQFYARKNVCGEALTYQASVLHRTSASEKTSTHCHTDEERLRVLETFGFSERHIRRIPPDGTSPA